LKSCPRRTRKSNPPVKPTSDWVFVIVESDMGLNQASRNVHDGGKRGDRIPSRATSCYTVTENGVRRLLIKDQEENFDVRGVQEQVTKKKYKGKNRRLCQSVTKKKNTDYSL